MRLVLVISSLASGGAARVMSIMANYWAAKGWQITILTFSDGSTPPFYDLDQRICQKNLNVVKTSDNSIKALLNNFKRIKSIRATIKSIKPDIVVSFIHKVNILTLLATQGLNTRIVVSERTDPKEFKLSWTWNQLRQLTYDKADKIVVQTKDVIDFFPNFTSNLSIIPNPVIFSERQSNSLPIDFSGPSIIAIGRFSEEKRFDLLLKSFAQLKDSFPEWTLTILGDGVLRPDIESLAADLGLSDRLHLPGSVKNIYDFLNKAKIFVMSSRFEGFPNALCEAMACGLAVISTDSSGAREIIRNGIDGLLVHKGEVGALAEAMEYLMSNEVERQRLASRATEITKRFSLEKVMGMWEDMFEQLLKEEL